MSLIFVLHLTIVCSRPDEGDRSLLPAAYAVHFKNSQQGKKFHVQCLFASLHPDTMSFVFASGS